MLRHPIVLGPDVDQPTTEVNVFPGEPHQLADPHACERQHFQNGTLRLLTGTEDHLHLSQVEARLRLLASSAGSQPHERILRKQRALRSPVDQLLDDDHLVPDRVLRVSRLPTRGPVLLHEGEADLVRVPDPRHLDEIQERREATVVSGHCLGAPALALDALKVLLAHVTDGDTNAPLR
jgi:hypothetical protein